MTYPQQYQQMPQAPQMPQQPGYPAQPMAPQMPVAPQQYAQPQYTQPGYPAPAPQPPAAPLATGTLDAYYAQPNVTGGPSWSFQGKPVGTAYAGIVERAITNGDIEQQTQIGTNAPAFYRDGRPKFVMKVPMLMAPDAEHPDGKAVWYVRGQARDELNRAMAEAGAPEGPPEPGAAITVQLVAQKPPRQAGFNPTNQYAVRYQRPQGAAAVQPSAAAAPVAEPVQAPPPVAPPAPVQQPAPAPVAAPSPASAPTPAAAPVAAAPLPGAPGLDPAQQNMLATMLGQQPPAA